MVSDSKLSGALIKQAERTAKALNRSVAEQIEHWVRIGMVAEENPDLTYEFIKKILSAQQEAQLCVCANKWIIPRT
jgi:DNA polymerase III psi subunit